MRIKVNVLSEKSVDYAIRRMEARKKWLDRKAKLFLQKMQEIGMSAARMYYGKAALAGYNDATVDTAVKVERIHNGYRAKVRAYGETVLFIEFGTGLRFENDYQLAHNFYAGSYGQGKGANPKGWFYTGQVGALAPPGTEPAYKRKNTVHTYGNPPTMTMYNTVHQLETLFSGIAQEVFRD